MDPRATHDHPAAVLVDRIVDQTRADLGREGRSVSDRTTALLSSMIAIVVLCHDTLLEHNVLKKITFDEDSWTFARRLFVKWKGEDVVPANVGQLLRFLRNSLAHGNVNLDPSVELVSDHDLGVTFERPANFRLEVSADFNGVVIWENQRGTTMRKPEVTLSIGDMWSLIEGLQALVHDKRTWSHHAKQWGPGDWLWRDKGPV